MAVRSNVFATTMEAFDSLPPILRQRLANANHNWSPLQIVAVLNGRIPREEIKVAEVLAILEGFV